MLRQLLEQAELADEVGLHAFAVGEHHRRDFAVSAPEVFLAAAAARTKHIRLGSAVTVLSSDDPIRVFQRFATVDAISNGRAEVMLGRGSFIESFPLFGLDLADYEVLFEEKLELFDKVRAQKPVHWEGRTRPAINGLSVYPPLEHHLLPDLDRRRRHPRVGAALRRVRLPDHLRDHRRPAAVLRAPGQPLPRGHGQVRPPDAADGHAFTRPRGRHGRGGPGGVLPALARQRNRIGAERGWGPASRGEFEAMCTPEGALYVGSPETVAAKIARLKKNLGVDRFDLKYSNGTLPHAAMMRSIELFGTEVAPRVAALLAARSHPARELKE